MIKRIRTNLLPLVLLISGGVNAQDSSGRLNLFESVEQPANTQPQRRPRPNGSSVRPDANKPAFTLKGTSRVGDRYSAILEHSSGTAISVPLQVGVNTPVPGYADYRVASFSPGSVSLLLPDTDQCTESSALGIRCSQTGDVALLTLANGDPVVSQPAETDLLAQALSAASVDAEGETENAPATTNPFAALRATANGANPADGSSTPRIVAPRKIDPADVPPGKRVISTPFGDRLVDI